MPFQNSSPNGLEVDTRYNIDVLINKDFKGVPAGTQLSIPSSKIMLKQTDPYDVSGNPGYTNLTVNIPSTTLDVKLTSSCQYSLSNNGVVDFGDQKVSGITTDRATTLKRSLTLNMKNCYGVSKVKTTITSTGSKLNSGQLLANTLTSGAKNLGLGISVASTAPENKNVMMYMDGTHQQNWSFNNTYSFSPINKTIPLDVFLLKSGGDITPGDFKATATIMMDFI